MPNDLMNGSDDNARKDEPSVPHSQLPASNGSSQADAGEAEEAKPAIFDPLEGMSEIDRFGLAGYDLLMRIPSYRNVSAGPPTSNTNLGFSDASEYSICLP